MAPPAKIKTWQHATNLNPGFNGSDELDVDNLFLLVKDALTGFALNPWTVAGSCDSVTAGMDAVDRLVDAGDIVHSGGAHSWIVLQQDAISANTQILFDFLSGNPREYYIYMSPSVGFSGGNTTTRPTAADEVAILFNPREFVSGPGFQFSAGQGTSVRAHVMMSTDGKCTRILTSQANICRFWLFIEVPLTPPTGWSNPVVMGCYGDANTQVVPNDPLSAVRLTQQADIWRAQGPIGVMYMNATLLAFATNGTSDGTILGFTPWPNPDEASGEYPMSAVGIEHRTTVGQRGRHGYIADMYLTAFTVNQGNSFPGDGSKSWMVFGNFALPWDGGDIEMG